VLIEPRGEQVIAMDLGLSGPAPGLYENDVVGERETFDQLKAFSAYAKNLNHAASNDDVVVVDIMLLFTQNIADTFPCDMTQTLMEYLVFKANQTFFDSRISMRLRLVHSEFVDYPNPSSIVSLNALREALDDDPSTTTAPSLAHLASLRNTFSVDSDNDGTGDNADTDDDNDNLPDAYETANQLDPLDGSDAQQDADNDGSSNIEEFEAGSNPNDPHSTPEDPDIPETSSGGGSIGLSWICLVLTLVIIRRRINAILSGRLAHSYPFHEHSD
jgi:hypothetical protein